MKKRQALAALLVGTMAVTTMTGCGNGNSTETKGETKTAAEGTTAEEKTAENTERVKIRIVSGDPVELPPEGENWMDEALSEAIGADVEFSILGAGSDYATALNVQISGGDTPDIFAVPARPDANSTSVINKETYQQYAKNGVIMSISPYLDQLTAVTDFAGMPKTADLYEDQAYLIPILRTSESTTIFTANMIRTDWLKNVGLEKPTTPEELLEAAKKFTFEDPDGNGKQDTYGISGPGLGVYDSILNGYGASVSNDILIKDGKVTSSLLSPYMKEGLNMCKAFVDAGVVDPDMLANTGTVATDKAVQGMYGITNASYAGLLRPTTQEQVHEVNPDAIWELYDALEGPDGAACGKYDFAETRTKYVIGKHVEDDPAKLEKVIELLNYLASEEGQRLTSYGLEGPHYNLVDGEPVATDVMLEETDFAYAYQLIGRDDSEYLKVKFPEWKDLIPAAKAYPRFEVYNSAVTPPEGFYMEDFNKYINEEMTKFIYGQRDIEEYDQFLKELDNMFGFSDFMKVAEEQLGAQGYLK
ncbi:MAG: hypothetical protein ACOX8K_13125 [Lachnospiraceae bacterium]|jgi:putative aldouronate transport system substrate-binding protein